MSWSSLFMVSALLLGLLSGPASAHDIGVTRATLAEQGGGAYALTAEIGPGALRLHMPPVLPEACRFDGRPSGSPSAGGHVWRFSCTNGLTAVDALRLPWQRDGTLITAEWDDGNSATKLFTPTAGEIVVLLSDLRAGSGSSFAAARRFTVLGVEHILTGIDHLLFVLLLIYLTGGVRRLIGVITAFTLAHSVTLGLATFGYIRLPPAPVEAAIALSIVFLAAENVYVRQGRPGLTYRHPWSVAFGFGLLHGLGFAGALASIGVPAGETPLALLFFNIGVEVGQILFVLAVLAIGRALRPIARLPQMVPVLGAGTIAAFWFFDRLAAIVV